MTWQIILSIHNFPSKLLCFRNSAACVEMSEFLLMIDDFVFWLGNGRAVKQFFVALYFNLKLFDRKKRFLLLLICTYVILTWIDVVLYSWDDNPLFFSRNHQLWVAVIVMNSGGLRFTSVNIFMARSIK